MMSITMGLEKTEERFLPLKCPTQRWRSLQALQRRRRTLPSGPAPACLSARADRLYCTLPDFGETAARRSSVCCTA